MTVETAVTLDAGVIADNRDWSGNRDSRYWSDSRDSRDSRYRSDSRQ